MVKLSRLAMLGVFWLDLQCWGVLVELQCWGVLVGITMFGVFG